MQGLQIIEIKGVRVLTTKQIAQMYGTTEERVRQNYKANRKKYFKSKHYILLEGEELRMFKKQVGKTYLVDKRPSHFMIWTEKGCLLHAKSINTDKAWEVYDWLVDFYFRVKSAKVSCENEAQKALSTKEKALDIPNNREMQDKIRKLENCCTAMRCVLQLYNRYIEKETAQALIKAMSYIVMEIASESYRLKEIKVAEIKV